MISVTRCTEPGMAQVGAAQKLIRRRLSCEIDSQTVRRNFIHGVLLKRRRHTNKLDWQLLAAKYSVQKCMKNTHRMTHTSTLAHTHAYALTHAHTHTRTYIHTHTEWRTQTRMHKIYRNMCSDNNKEQKQNAWLLVNDIMNCQIENC